MILYHDTLILLIFSIFVTKCTSIVLMLSMLGKKKPAADNLNFFSYLSKKIGFDISCKLSP